MRHWLTFSPASPPSVAVAALPAAGSIGGKTASLGSLVPSEPDSLVVSSPAISAAGSLLSGGSGTGVPPASAGGSELPSSDLGAKSAEAASSAPSSLGFPSSSFSSGFVSCSVNTQWT